MSPSREFYKSILAEEAEKIVGVGKWAAARYSKSTWGQEYFCKIKSPKISLFGYLRPGTLDVGEGSLSIPLGPGIHGGLQNRQLFKNPEDAKLCYKELGLGFKKSYGGIECTTSGMGDIWGLNFDRN